MDWVNALQPNCTWNKIKQVPPRVSSIKPFHLPWIEEGLETHRFSSNLSFYHGQSEVVSANEEQIKIFSQVVGKAWPNKVWVNDSNSMANFVNWQWPARQLQNENDRNGLKCSLGCQGRVPNILDWAVSIHEDTYTSYLGFQQWPEWQNAKRKLPEWFKMRLMGLENLGFWLAYFAGIWGRTALLNFQCFNFWFPSYFSRTCWCFVYTPAWWLLSPI